MADAKEKFVLLMRKHWLLTKRRSLKMVSEIVYPILICVMLIAIRRKSEENDEMHFPPFSVSEGDRICNKSNEKNTVAFSPNSPLFHRILSNICPNVSSFAFPTAEELNKEIEENVDFTQLLLFAVLFNDDLEDINNTRYLENTEIILRLPTSSKENIDEKWFTKKLFPSVKVTGPRAPESTYGGKPNYHLRGFLQLQEAIILGFINDGKKDPPEVNITMQRFPHPEWLDDTFYDRNTAFMLAILISICFMLRYAYSLQEITLEKEHQLKEAMKVMGLPGWLLWISWFTYNFILLLVVVVIMAFLLTLPVNGLPVFAQSDRYVLILFFILASCSVIAFSFFISTLFSKASKASAVGGLFFIFSEIPYIVHNHDTGLSNVLTTCLLVGTAICYGVEIFVNFEAAEEGIHWHNIWSKPVTSNQLFLGPILLILVVDTILYLVLAVYLDKVWPGGYRIPRPWYFLCSSSKKPRTYDLEERLGESRSTFEAHSRDFTVGIELENVSKTFGIEKVVKNLNLIVYESQITVLLGLNGAGKTTTMLMITGMVLPTSGKIKVYGFEVGKSTKKVRANLGMCLQHNIVFDDMTLFEHLYFCCMLKGTRQDTIYAEISDYIKTLELEDKKTVRGKKLSEEVKRKLNIAMAFCGGNKVVALDAPFQGLDPASRKTVWELLQKHKEGRTILLTTYVLDEAAMLGDRIAVMTSGELEGYGTTSFLKKQFASGYYLILNTTSRCNPRILTNDFRKFISSVKPLSYVSLQLIYRLPESDVPKYESLLSYIENNKKQLEIISYGILPRSLEEVFLKVGVDESAKIARPIIRGSQKELRSYGLVTGPSLIFNQIAAMFIKKIMCISRAWLLLIFTQMIIPVALILWLILSVGRTLENRNRISALNITLNSYHNPVTLLGGEENDYYRMYEKALEGYDLRKVSDVATEIFQKKTVAPLEAKTHYIVAASFRENTATAWFDGSAYHSPPLALGLLLEAIFKKHLGKLKSINFVNYPLPVTAQAKPNIFDDIVEFQLAFALEYVMICVTSVYILFYIKERVCKFKHLQFAAGVSPFLFWTVSFLCDLIVYFAAVCVVLITIMLLEVEHASEEHHLKRLLLLLISFGFFVFPLLYVASHFFTVPVNGYSAVLVMSFTTGIVGNIVVRALNQEISIYAHWILIFTPFYLLMSGIIVLIDKYNLKEICQKYGSFENACQKDDKCCDIDNFYSLSPHGIGRHILIAFSMSVLLFSILLCKEYRCFRFLSCEFNDEEPDYNVTLEKDVQEETRKIRTTDLRILTKTYVLVFRDLTKRYNKIPVVNGICLGLRPFECFGLVGANGAGKTTLIRMAIGELPIRYGEVYINELSVERHLKKIQKFIGYCPENGALLEELTPRETIKMFALIRGTPMAGSPRLVEDLAEEFDFSSYLDEKIENLSGSTKRKLSIALSVIGNPLIIFLDEPTNGMDPATKRYVWSALAKFKENGNVIVLSTHNVEECEALCSKLVIMVNGNFRCLGSVQRLRSKFASGYELIIKVAKTEDLDNVKEIHTFVLKNFPGAVLKDRYQYLLTYELDDALVPYSSVFKLMEEKKDTMDVEDYSVGQYTLEQVFISFTKDQK